MLIYASRWVGKTAWSTAFAVLLAACGSNVESAADRVTPVVGVSWQPPVAIPVKITVDSTGQVSISGSAELVTFLGVFEITTSVSVSEDDAIIVVVNDRTTNTARRYRVSTTSGRLLASVTGPSTTLVEGRVVTIDVAPNSDTTIQFVTRDSTNISDARPVDRPRTFTEEVVCPQCMCIDLTCEQDINLPDDTLACARELGISDQAILFLVNHIAAVTSFERYPALDVAEAVDPYCAAGTSWSDVFVLNGPQAALSLSSIMYDHVDQWAQEVEQRLGTSGTMMGMGLVSVEVHDDETMTVITGVNFQECGACDILGWAELAFEFQSSGDLSAVSLRDMGSVN